MKGSPFDFGFMNKAKIVEDIRSILISSNSVGIWICSELQTTL